MHEQPQDEAFEGVEKRRKFTSMAIVLLLIFGLSAFGIEGLTRVKGSYIIKAGNKKITPEGFAAFLDSQKKEYISRFGSGIIEAFLNKQEFLIGTANIMADQLLISKFLEDSNVIINKDTINTYINNSPQFQTPEGKFDKNFYKDYISQMGFQEGEFIAQQIPHLQTVFFLSLVDMISLSDLKEFAGKIIAAQRQKREIEVIQIPVSSSVAKNYEPSEIEAYYETNKEEFAKPEEREVSFAKIDPQSSLGFLQPSNNDLISEYRKQYVAKGAKISFVQSSFLKQEDADAVLKNSKNENILGNDFNEIPFEDLAPEIGNHLLSLKEGEISPVFYSGGRHNILKLVKIIKPSKVEPFEKVKPKLLEQYKSSGICAEIEKIANHISKEADSGEILEKALPKGLSLKNISVNAGTSSKEIPENIKNVILEDTDIHYAKILKSPSACEYYAYKIDKITPKSYLELEDARLQIEKKLSNFKGKEEAFEKAVQKSKNMEKEGRPMLLEREGNSLFTEQTSNAIFSLQEQEILPPVLSKDGKSYLIIKLKKIRNIEESGIANSEIEKMVKTIRESQKEEVLRALLLALRTKYNLSINYKALGRI